MSGGWRHVQSRLTRRCAYDMDDWPCDAEQMRLERDALRAALDWFVSNAPKTWDDTLSGCRYCLALGDEHEPDCGYIAALSSKTPVTT